MSGIAPNRPIAGNGPIAGFELLAPVEAIAPGYRELQPLEGVRWPVARETCTGERDGQVAMFEVVDRGELQDWLEV